MAAGAYYECNGVNVSQTYHTCINGSCSANGSYGQIDGCNVTIYCDDNNSPGVQLSADRTSWTCLPGAPDPNKNQGDPSDDDGTDEADDGPADNNSADTSQPSDAGQSGDSASDPGTKDAGVVGEPINTATGNKFSIVRDVRFGGASPLRFVRYYNSASVAAGSLGNNWRSSFDRSLVLDPIKIRAIRPSGQQYNFYLSSGTWQATSGDITGQLQATGNGWTYTTPKNVIETYDSTGKLLTIASIKGVTQTVSYDSAGHISAVADSFGNTLQISSDAQGKIASVKTSDGRTWAYGYDSSNNLVQLTNPDNSVRKYLYQGQAGLLTGVIDEDGNRTSTTTYDTQGRAISMAGPGGAGNVTVTYNSDGSATVVDGVGTARTYAFSLIQRRLKNTSRQQPGGISSAASFDANANVQSKTDANGNVTQYSYDLTRNLEISRTEAYGTPIARTITTQWHPTFRLPTQISEPGRRITFTYDANGNRLTRTVIDTTTYESRTVTWTYNSLGQVLTVKDPRNNVTTFTYDAHGNLSAITNALNQATTIDQYDALGNPGRITDPNGVATTLAYDLRQRLTSRTVAGATTSFQYDAVGQLIKTTLPDGSFISNIYDPAHRLTDVTDSLGNTIHYTLDALGNRTRTDTKDPSGNIKRTQSQVFDSLGRLQKVLGANGQATVYGYDARGNRTTETQQTPSGNFITTTAYDALNRAKTVTDAANGVTTYGYNPLSQLISVTDPKSLTTTYSYNALGDLKKLVSPDAGTKTYTYDADGNRVTETDARGITTTSAYDALNRLLSKSSPGQGTQAAFGYDGTNFSSTMPNGIGRLTYVQHQYGHYTLYRYDARGNVIGSALTVYGWGPAPVETYPTHVYATQYSYDSADRLSAITYPGGTVVNYSRDVVGRVSSIAAQANGQTSTIASAISYLPFGPATGMTMGNGIAVSKLYDQDYRQTGISAGSVLNRTLSYDVRNLITGITDSLDSTRSQGFQYDPLARLTQAAGSYGALSYAYDAVGNRTRQTAGSSTDSYTYTASSNQLQGISGPDASTFTYDAAGNTVQKGAFGYTYSDDGRPRAVSQNGATVDLFSYTAEGHRLGKFHYSNLSPGTAGDEAFIYHYDLQGHLIEETQGDATVIRDYVWLGDQPIAMIGKRKAPVATPLDPTLNSTLNTGPPNALYHFDTENVTPPSLTVTTPDSSPNGLTATLGGSVLPTLVPSPWLGLGNAFSFDGVNRGISSGANGTSFIDFGFSSALALRGNNTFTLDIRFQASSLPTIPAPILVRGAFLPIENAAFDYNLYLDRSHDVVEWVQFLYADSSPKGFSQINVPLPAGQELAPHTVRVTSNGTAVAMTVDGIAGTLIPSTNPVPRSDPAGFSAVLAGIPPGNNNAIPFPGVIDELRFSNSVRTDGVLPPLAANPVIPQPEIFYFHADHLGTPQKLTDSTGAIVWDASYDPFGNAKLNTELVVQPLRFPGQYFDAETGLYQNWHRDYDPSIGRYLQSDPIGLRGGLNTYAYVDGVGILGGHCNPISCVDPAGLFGFNEHFALGYATGLEAGYGVLDAVELGAYTALADLGTQQVEMANAHSMAIPGQSPEEARQARDAFVEMYANPNNLEELGRALHAVQDEFAADHDFKTYNGQVSSGHIDNDVYPDASNFNGAYDASVSFLRSIGGGRGNEK